MTQHSYAGTIQEGAEWRGVCLCGHRSQPSPVKTTAQKRVIDHAAKGRAKDAAREAARLRKERSARMKKIAAAKKREAR